MHVQVFLAILDAFRIKYTPPRALFFFYFWQKCWQTDTLERVNRVFYFFIFLKNFDFFEKIFIFFKKYASVSTVSSVLVGPPY